MPRNKLMITILAVFLLTSVLAACTAPAASVPQTSGMTQNPEPQELVTVYCLLETWSWRIRDVQSRHSIFTYTDDGYLLERKSKTTGSYMTEETYRYDDAGNLVYGPLGVGGSFVPVTYTYDDKGRMLSKSWQDVRYAKKEVYAYDEADHLIMKECWTEDRLSKRITYVYNKDGQKTFEEWNNGSGNNGNIRIFWEYDDRGKLLSETTYYSGTPKIEEVRNYDENGLLQSVKRWMNGRAEFYACYEYDEDGRLIREEGDQRGAIPEDPALYYFMNTYEYDEWDNVIRKTSVLEDSEPSDIFWTYDSQGNMLSQEFGDSRTVWTYDEWGNMLSYHQYYDGSLLYEVIYTYTSFLVTPEQAEEVRQQQDQYYGGPGYLD